jgi:hypothetical protein
MLVLKGLSLSFLIKENVLICLCQTCTYNQHSPGLNCSHFLHLIHTEISIYSLYNVYFRRTLQRNYLFSGNWAASVPVSTFKCPLAVYIFPGSVHKFFSCLLTPQFLNRRLSLNWSSSPPRYHFGYGTEETPLCVLGR